MTDQAVAVNVAKASSINPSSKILIVDGTTTLIGGPPPTGGPVTDNSLIWNFKTVDGAGITDNSDLYLVVDIAPVQDVAHTANDVHVAKVLLDLAGHTNDPQIHDVLDFLSEAETPEEAHHVLESTQPPADGGSAVETLTFVDNALNLTGERLNELFMAGNDAGAGVSGISAGGISPFSGKHVWGQISGQKERQGARDGVPGFGQPRGRHLRHGHGQYFRSRHPRRHLQLRQDACRFPERHPDGHRHRRLSGHALQQL
jgi:hypothetical protein